MYIYLGCDTVITADRIVGVFDLDNTSVSKDTRGYLSAAQKMGKIVEVSQDLPKSFIVCDKSVYLSQSMTSTLKKRAARFKEDINY